MPNSAIIPCLRYRDAPAAIEWIVRVFGFEKHLVVPDAMGSITHAQLSLGGGMIMLGSVADTPFGLHLKQPDEVGGIETQSAYIVVADGQNMVGFLGWALTDEARAESWL